MLTILLVPLILVALILPYLVLTYNSFVTLQARIKEAFSGIDIQLKRRADLIPNLVETVKGYAKHEEGVFSKVTEARSAMMSAGTTQEKAAADNMLSGALKSLFAVAEAYPELKANENFKDLQRQLEDTEDKIAYSRKFYNTNVLEFNTKMKVFPSNIIASFMKLSEVEFFEAEVAEREKVEVKF